MDMFHGAIAKDIRRASHQTKNPKANEYEKSINRLASSSTEITTTVSKIAALFVQKL